MKKTILAMLLVGSSCALFAQVDTSNRNMGNTSGNNNLSSNSSYNAYGSYTAIAPDYVQGYVLRDYPMATDIHWQQSNDWWHGYYSYNGQPMHVYYNTAGQTFNVSLPVKQTLVPDAVVSMANQMYGPTVYDVTAIKGTNGQQIYQVRTIENGQISSQWIGEDGSKVIDIYRTESVDPMNTGNLNSNNMNGQMNSNTNQWNNNAAGTSTSVNTTDNMNTGSDTNADMSNTGTGNDKLKIKTKTSDGKKSKTKVVNGKVTTKGDQ